MLVTCDACGQVFSTSNRSKRCSPCCRDAAESARKKAYYEANADRINARRKAERDADPEAHRAFARLLRAVDKPPRSKIRPTRPA